MFERIKPTLYLTAFGLILSTLWAVAQARALEARVEQGWMAPIAIDGVAHAPPLSDPPRVIATAPLD